MATEDGYRTYTSRLPEGDFPMTTAIFEPMATIMTAVEPAERAELAGGQLVRGQAARLVERLQPLVFQRDVTLDLAEVDRIDAAGITALVSLYQSARESGHCFCLTNATERVAHILTVVGLDHHFFSHNVVQSSHYGSNERRPAA
jgi:anti-anti-sigma factor